MAKIPIDLIEQSEASFSFEKLGLFSLLDRENFLSNATVLVNVLPGLDGQTIRIISDSRVGVIELPMARIQVRPKISARQFTSLLRYALGGQIKPTLLGSSNIEWGKGFENALCAIFCSEIRTILDLGISRKYVEHREPIQFLRGRPIWQANFPWLGSKAREINCKYHRLTYDNPDNQLILAGLERACSLVNGETREILFQQLHTFRDLAKSTSPAPTDFDQVKSQYNRLNEHYAVAHGLSRMFILGLRPQSFFEAGPQKIFGIVLDMADLFEKFVERILRDSLGPNGFAIKSQCPDKGALLDAEDNVYASVRPDFLVYKANKPAAVIDAKYKQYWPREADGVRPRRKIANEDIYQLFFYQQRLQRVHNLLAPPSAVIIAPLPDEEERGDDLIISERFSQVKWRSGFDTAGQLRLLLVPVTKLLSIAEEQRSMQKAATITEFVRDLLGIL